MEGGKFLGSGTYGCIFYPPIKCNNNIFSTQNGVGKIFADNKESDIEKNTGKKINSIDKNGDFTNPLIHSCKVSLANIIKNDTNKQCVHAKVNKDYEQLIYKYKGVDYSHFLRNVEYNLFDEKTVNYMLNLFKSVKVLQTNKMLHLDIKPENILITENDRLLLIDFGLARSFDEIYDIKKSHYLLEYDYHIYPPEFKSFLAIKSLKKNAVMSTIGTSSPKYFTTWKKKIFRYMHNWYAGYQHIQQYFDEIGVFFPDLECENSRFFTHLEFLMLQKKMNHTSCFCNIYNDFVHKIDVFSIGIVLLYTYCNASDKKKLDGKRKYEFIKLIRKCINMNPFERITIDEVIKEFRQINKIKDSPESQKKQVPTIDSPSNKQASSQVTEEYCMNYFTKKELNDIVDMEIKKGNKDISKSFKKMNKKELCNALYKYLGKKQNNTTIVKPGRKKKA